MYEDYNLLVIFHHNWSPLSSVNQQWEAEKGFMEATVSIRGGPEQPLGRQRSKRHLISCNNVSARQAGTV